MQVLLVVAVAFFVQGIRVVPERSPVSLPSSPTSARMSDSELVSALYALQLENWLGMSMSALAAFEYVGTLDQEMSSVWRQKRSGASLLLFAVRYTMLAAAIGNFVGYTLSDYQTCMRHAIAGDVLGVLAFLLTAAFSALRVHALSGGNAILSTMTFLLQLSPAVVNVYSYIGEKYSFDPLFGCEGAFRFDSKIQEILILASRIPLTLGDALAVAVTWIQSFQQLRMHRNLGVQSTLSTVLFRDGTMYFLVILILNILEIAPLTSSQAGYVVSALNSGMPLILVHRFMLNLRQLSDLDTRSASHTLTVSMPRFRMNIDVAGNMGESLDHGWGTEGRGDDELDSREISRGGGQNDSLGYLSG